MMSIFTFSKNTFEGQLPGEETILVTRKHWIFLVLPLFLIFLLGAMILAFTFWISSFSWYERFSPIWQFILSLIFLILWNLGFWWIMIYSLNTIIITNKRIIENKQLGLFKHIVNELQLKDIQDISVKIIGPFAHLMNYGDIEVQSAGTVAKFFFNQLPWPEKIKNVIMEQKIKES